MRRGAIGVILVLLVWSHAQATERAFRFRVMPAPPDLSATIQFSEPSGNSILDGDETGKLILTLRNTGRGDAFDCLAEVKMEPALKGVTFDRRIPLGTVPAGGEVRREIPIAAGENIPDAVLSLTVGITEANGFDPPPVRVTFGTRAFEPPKLIVADMGVNDQNGNSRVEPMEMVELVVRVQNIGHGDAREVTAELDLGRNVFLAGDSQTSYSLGALPSGRFRDFRFLFYTNNRIANGETIPIVIRLNEARPQFRAAHPVPLVMNAPQRRLEEVVVRGAPAERRGEIAPAGGLSVDVHMNIPEGQRAGKFDVAVVIGNRNYAASGVPDVEFAYQDARIMREYLIRTLGYDPENILYAEDATLTRFNEFFGSERDHRGRLFRFVKEGVSRVFIYYVGHGAPDLEKHEAYFVPVDASVQELKSNGYRLQTFYDNLAKIPARSMTVVLDTCFSGNSDRGLLFRDISPALVKVKREFRGPANAVLITSAALDQVSTWYREKRHSLFTYYFLKALQGDGDGNRDGRLTVGEMAAYLKEHVPYMARRLANVEQQPMITGNPAEVLVEYRR